MFSDKMPFFLYFCSLRTFFFKCCSKLSLYHEKWLYLYKYTNRGKQSSLPIGNSLTCPSHFSFLLLWSLACMFPQACSPFEETQIRPSIYWHKPGFQVSFAEFSVNGGVVPFPLMWESFSCIFLDLSGAGRGEWGDYNHSTPRTLLELLQ